MKFESGDLVLADRGFTINDILPEGVSCKIPAFLDGREQFTEEEVIESQAITRENTY